MHELRKQYTRGGLNDQDMLDDPLDQLKLWFELAVQEVDVDWFEPNAVTLATASPEGDVTARIVLLKGVDERGLLFYTNYESPKGKQLEQNPLAAIVVYWPHLERQIRVEGKVEKTTREMSERYFHSRPRGSQISAAISDQSAEVASRGELEAKAKELEESLRGQTVPLPETWGGYRLEPLRFEFWQGRENRLHDRYQYDRDGATWKRVRLAP